MVRRIGFEFGTSVDYSLNTIINLTTAMKENFISPIY
ncbi:hypothetical protein B6N60_04015 [Richelia sinica FACHB-800]|uniref:Uncharacterized protein n=1 Tax=Richelia sinica FACHB-800 TaxID=1357546 RepID=A0A975TCC9_9NOST|nr:hypothetical protein B6N60_04015 [Richelia sinica FACHB-800]